MRCEARRSMPRLPTRDAAGPPVKRVFGVPHWLLLHTARAAIALVAATLRHNPAARLAALWDVAYGMGVAHEMRTQRHAAQATAAGD